MSGSLPTTLGKYQIIREIARSNDIVYEAYDPAMNRRVAVKELAVPSGSTQQSKEERVKRFMREAKAAGSLSHPNIVTIFEVGEDAGRYFLAMEYLDGKTLRNELDASGFLPAAKAVDVAVEVLSALEFSHRNGVVHRDVKPENVQLLTDGRVKLTDFGIARLVFEPNITMDGQVFGTPSYMSPEQVVGKEIDVRSDVFSLGTILYEMLSGQKPFKGDNVVAISYAITHKDPDPLPQVPHAIWQVVRRALEKSPAQRFDSAKQMSDALKAAITSPEPSPPPFQPTATFTPPMQNVPPVIHGQAPPMAGSYQQGFKPPPGSNPFNFGGRGGPQPSPFIPPAAARKPMLTPDQAFFARKAGTIVLAVVALFVLLFVGLNRLADSMGRYTDSQSDQRLLSDLRGAAGMAVNDKIAEYELKIGRMSSAYYREQARGDLAVLYEERGKELVARGMLDEAYAAFSTARDLDPTHAAYATDLASLFELLAKRESDLGSRVGRYEQASNAWLEAAKLDRGEQKRDYEDAAGLALMQAARELRLAGRTNDAQRLVNRAYDISPPQSRTRQAIGQWR